jgi:hypothetical protein
MVLAMAGGARPAQAQEYPFFVQPMSVQDVRLMCRQLELSREQQLAALTNYESYNLAFEELQNKEVKVVMDHLMDLFTRVRWWGGEFEIPERDEVNAIVRESLAAIRAFGKIDDRYFDTLIPLLSDAQLAGLEGERDRRALGRLSMLHQRLVGEINDGASPDLLGIMRRVDIPRDVDAQVDAVLASHAKRSLTVLTRFEVASKEAIDQLLDEVDALGLRDMDMAAMMMFAADEENQSRMIAIFDEVTKPLQERAALMARENRRAYDDLMELLPPEQAADLRGRFIGRGYRDADRGLGKARSALKRLSEEAEGQPHQADLDAAVAELDKAWDSLATKYMAALDAQRAYRTMAQLQGEVALEAEDRVAAAERQREATLAKAKKVVDRYSTEEETASAEGRKDGAGGGGRKPLTDKQAAAKMSIEPLSAEQIGQFGRWLGADEDALTLIGAMHEAYEAEAWSVLSGHGRRAAAADGEADEDESWRDRRARWRDARATASSAFDEVEETLFSDLVLALPDSIDRDRIARLREAMRRSRNRQRIAAEDWALRSAQESVIDLVIVVLGTDPSDLTPDQRTSILDGLIAYDQKTMPLVEELGERTEKVRALERRLWSGTEEYDAEVRQAMRRKWESRREEVTEVAAKLARLNRETAEGIIASLPDSASWAIQDAYERAAYPEVFKTERSVDPVIEQLTMLELTPDQQRQIESRAAAYREAWLDLTRQMVAAKRDKPAGRSFPPTRESLTADLLMVRLQYGRAQLDQRTLVQLELLLEPAQAAEVPAFADAEEQGG